MKHILMKKKLLLVVALLILISSIAVGVTTAFLLDKTGPVENVFQPTKVTSSVDETVSDGKKASVKIQNTGTTDAYIRVAVIANSVNDSGGVTGSADVTSALAASGWAKNGDYYYWASKVAPNAKTGELLKSAIDLEGLQVTILAEAIQAEPASAVQEAWGVSLGGSSN